ncbi:hypothetical protein ACWPKO_10645 [Coraliomargarita sp. W4R53]
MTAAGLGWLAAGVASLALLSLLMSRRSSRALMMYRVLLILLAVLIPVTAHFGGSLVYGIDYFSF